MSRGRAYVAVALAAALPRLAIVFIERGDILSAYTEKSDSFAQTFVAHGTFGFIPGEPSAYTQPLYGWFLIPLYWILGRHWWTVGFAQTIVAVAVALLVYEIGRRVLSPRAGVVAAVIATLNPYLVWHDVHVNREIVDQLVAAGLVLVTLVLAGRRSLWLGALAGLLCGLAILGNTRLVALPLLIVAYLFWRGHHVARATSLVVLATTALALTPWLVRNEVEIGCFTLTTDGRALWKANNPQTYGLLASGQWIDNIPRQPWEPLNPEEAVLYYDNLGQKRHVDECRNMRLYQRRVTRFWRDHPGAKAKLAAQAVRMLWDPRPTFTSGRPERGGTVDAARRFAQPLWTGALFALGIVGLFVAPRPYVALALALLAYQTVAAMVFVGATRYRIAWDFVIAILAAAALARIRRSRAS